MPRDANDFELVDEDQIRRQGGILQDGQRFRVSKMTRDAASQRTTDDVVRVVDDSGRSDIYAMSTPGPRHLDAGKSGVAHAELVTGDYVRESAYQRYKREMGGAWQRDSKSSGEGETRKPKPGDACTSSNGTPGKFDENLICIPHKAPAENPGDARDAAYREMVADMENAWQKRA